MTYSVVNTDLIIKFSGGLIGLVLSIIFALTLFKVTKKLSFSAFTISVTLIGFLFLVKQSVTIVQILLANALIQISPAIFKIILFLINNLDKFMYGLIGGVGLLYILSTLAVKKIIKQPTGAINPAQLRKIKAAARKDVRWLISAMSVLILISSLTTVQAAWANKKVHLSPATPVHAKDGLVTIPTEHVDDHNLHRFGYTASDGTEIRFLIIRKSETAYGIGLDACRICGVAGYYQRKDQVICSKCDVVMNIPTIGFPGGCNPVPVPFNMEKGNIVLDAQDFEKEKERFAETDIFNQ